MTDRIERSRAAGLPTWERWALRLALKSGSAFLSKRRALRMVTRETRQILQVIHDATGEDVFEQVQIPRLVGIQHSSCRWSVMMVVEHLCLTNRDLIRIVGSLAQGVSPRGAMTLEDYQPDTDVGWDTLDRYQEIMDQYANTVAQHDDLKTGTTFEHPWFGPLDAHQWLCLTGVHQWFHRRQARKIVAILGVA